VLEVRFFRDAQNRLAALSACGHADFDEYGQDIVCAAISAILQTAQLGLEHYAGGEIEAIQEPGKLRVDCTPSARDKESVAAILTAAELAVTQVARRYPEHVSLACERIGKT
jgi:uncharacterized protein